MVDLDAIVLATGESSRIRVAGLAARERAARVARKVGASRVFVVDDAAQLAELVAWRGTRTVPLLVIRADQLVHTPLVAPLVGAIPRDGAVLAVVPELPAADDLAAGAYAGAFVAAGAAAERGLELLASGITDDVTIAAAFPGATRVVHGDVARAPLGTREQNRAAHRLLYRILIKPQDNAITRYLFRPVSLPLTRMLVWTPITPNQISCFVALLCGLGCYFTARASMSSVLLGTVIALVGSYFDCCDGEVARVKLQSSRVGAWLDTVVDELSSLGYLIAIGWHCHLHFGPVAPWRTAIIVSATAMAWCIYCIYYNIIVAVGSANSQDYVGRFEVVPGKQPGSVRLAPAAAKAIVPTKPLPLPLDLAATDLPYIVRRDFISWLSVILAATQLTYVTFGMFVAGAIVTFCVLTVDHVKLRSLRRSIARRGLLLEAP
jgi:phosphatidylglycerophosphate synthase